MVSTAKVVMLKMSLTEPMVNIVSTVVLKLLDDVARTCTISPLTTAPLTEVNSPELTLYSPSVMSITVSRARPAMATVFEAVRVLRATPV